MSNNYIPTGKSAGGHEFNKPAVWNVKSYADMQPINCARCGRVIEWVELKNMHYSSRLFSFGNFPLLICSECAFEEGEQHANE